MFAPRLLTLALLIPCLPLACGAPAPTDPVDGGVPADASAVDAGAGDMAMAPKCTSASCGGCCDGDVCQPGVSDTSCGSKGASCQACPPTAQCMSGACGPGLDGMYTLTIEGANIDSRTPAGLYWDAPLGAPDPVMIFNSFSRTQEVSDSYSPYWGREVLITYKDLRAGNFVFSIIDKDLTSDDVIAGNTVLRPSDDDIRAGKFVILRSGSATSIRFTFKKQ